MHVSRVRSLSLVTAVVLTCSIASPAIAAGMTDPANAKLAQMENKYFDKTYDNETLDSRVARMETLFFGQSRTGDVQQRLQTLIGSLPPAEQGASNASSMKSEQPAMDTSYQGGSPASPNSFQPQNNNQYQPANNQYPQQNQYQPANQYQPNSQYQSNSQYQPNNQYQPPSPSGSGSGYSQNANGNGQTLAGGVGINETVSQLEQQVGGESHNQQPIPYRLTALENAVFGPNTDHHGTLNDRVTRLSGAISGGSADGAMANAPQQPPHYLQGFNNQNAHQQPQQPPQAYYPQQPQYPNYQNQKPNNGHPYLKTAAKVALVTAAVAAVAGVGILAAKGLSHHHGLDLD